MAYFYGEEGPLTAVFGWKPIEDAPDGYGFDFVNSDVVLHELSVEGWPSGYSGWHELSHSLSGRAKPAHDAAGVAQIASLVAQGAVLVGNRPTDSPSLADDEKELQRVADQLWGKDGCERDLERKVGKGRVYAGIERE